MELKLNVFFENSGIKVEKAIRRELVNVQAIRVYLPELGKEINQTVERGERPQLLIKLTKRQKTGEYEVEIVFLGNEAERHIETLRYYKKNPKNWKTWGLIVLTPKQAMKLACILKKIAENTTLISYNGRKITDFSEDVIN